MLGVPGSAFTHRPRSPDQARLDDLVRCEPMNGSGEGSVQSGMIAEDPDEQREVCVVDDQAARARSRKQQCKPS
jgi:hypothetical protein